MAVLVGRAEDAAARRDYAVALASVTSTYELLGSPMPSMRAPYDTNMLCSNVASKLGDFELAVEAAKMALVQIDLDGDNRLSAADKDHLPYYCKVVLMYCAYHLQDDALVQTARAIGVPFAALQGRNVRKRIVRTFPITRPTDE